MNMAPVKFKSKEEIRTFVDRVCEENGLSHQDELAKFLKVSSSAIQGYIFRREIPTKKYKAMINLKSTKADCVDLASISLDEILAEIERRGWKVDLKSK